MIKESVIKLVSYRIFKKVGVRLSDETVRELVFKIKGQETWPIQYISNIIGRILFKGSPLEVTQKGLEILEILPESLGRLIVSQNPDTGAYSGVFIVKDPLEIEESYKTLEPYEVDGNMLYLSNRDYCHKEYWRGTANELPTDVVHMLNDVVWKFNKTIFRIKDFSYENIKDSDKELDPISIRRETDRAERIKKKWENKEMRFKHFFDTRGRIYSEGYHLNPQGAKYKKALLEMVNYENILESYDEETLNKIKL